MATKYAQVSGDWSGNIWYDAESGGNQVSPPAEGDNAVINAGVEVSLDNESGVIVVGDDTGDALTINGTLKYTSSATNDVKLRPKGNLRGKSGGKFLVGSDTSPIVNTNFVIEYDYGNSGKSIYSENGFEWKMYGTRPSIWKTKLNGAVSAGATTIVTQDDTGWSVGDTIVIAGDESGKVEYAEISAITGTSITLSAGLSYDHDDGAYVLVMDRNIKVRPYSGSSRQKLNIQNTTNGEVFFKYVEFDISAGSDNKSSVVYSAEGCTYRGNFAVFYVDYQGGNRSASFVENVYANGCRLTSGYNSASWELLFENCFFLDIDYPTGSWRFMQGGGGRIDFINCYFEHWPANDSYWTYGFDGGSNHYFENCEFVRIAKTVHRFFLRDVCFYNCTFRKCSEIFDGNHNFFLSNCTFINSTASPFASGTVSGLNVLKNNSWDATYGNNIYDRNFTSDVKSQVIQVNGVSRKVARQYIEYGNGSAFSVIGRGEDGECFVINPKDSENYGYIYKDPSFLSALDYDFGSKVANALGDSFLYGDYFTSFPVNSGKTITLSFWVKVSTSGFDGDLQIAAEGCGINYSWTSVDLTGADSDWVQRSFTLGTTTDKGFVRLKIRAKDGATVSGDIYLDDFAITES